MAVQEIFMIFLHDVFDLIEVLFRELIAILEYAFDFIVDGIKRVEVLLLEVSLFCLVS